MFAGRGLHGIGDSKARWWPMKETRQHTAGPWHVGKPAPDMNTHCAVRDANGWEIAEIPGLKPHDLDLRADANARLIAAAPELLEACNEAAKELDTWHNWQLCTNSKYPKSEGAAKIRDILIKANTAIAKAGGGK